MHKIALIKVYEYSDNYGDSSQTVFTDLITDWEEVSTEDLNYLKKQ